MALKRDLVAVGIAALTGIGGYMVYKRSAKPGIESDGAPKLKDKESVKDSKLPQDKFEKRRLPEPDADVRKTPNADSKDA